MGHAKLAFLIIGLQVYGSLSELCTNDQPCVRFCCVNCTREFDIRNLPGADVISSVFTVLKGRPCRELFEADMDWKFQPNGEVLTEEDSRYQTYNTDEYCFDEELNDKWTLLLCFNEMVREVRYSLYPILMFVSLPFSIATFVVYSLIKELRNLHGKCLMSYVFSVIVLQLDLALIQLEAYEQGPACTIAGFVLYFAAFTTSFWLNVMTFDIWQTFKHFRVTSDTDRRFKLYFCYAFGVPLLMTICLAIIDILPLDILENRRPNFGTFHCAIETDHMEQYYYSFPISILHFSSAIFIILATFHFFKRSTLESATGYTRFDAEKDRFIMYLQLFAFMVVIWSFEVVSYFFRMNEFIVADICHCLQGAVIFAIFVLHRNTRELILKEYNLRKGISNESQPKTNDNDEETESNNGNFQKF